MAGFGVVFGADDLGVDVEPPEDGPAMRSHISLAWSATDFSGLDDFDVDESDGLRVSSSNSAASSSPSRTSSDENRDDVDEPDLTEALERPDESG